MLEGYLSKLQVYNQKVSVKITFVNFVHSTAGFGECTEYAFFDYVPEEI